jgi:hypothetical protein
MSFLVGVAREYALGEAARSSTDATISQSHNRVVAQKSAILANI